MDKCRQNWIWQSLQIPEKKQHVNQTLPMVSSKFLYRIPLNIKFYEYMSSERDKQLFIVTIWILHSICSLEGKCCQFSALPCKIIYPSAKKCDFIENDRSECTHLAKTLCSNRSHWIEHTELKYIQRELLRSHKGIRFHYSSSQLSRRRDKGGFGA